MAEVVIPTAVTRVDRHRALGWYRIAIARTLALLDFDGVINIASTQSVTGVVDARRLS